MKKFLLVLLTVLMTLTCFGCSGGEKEVDETPLIEIIKQIEPTTVGFYLAGESKNIEDYKDAKFIVANPIKTAEDAAIEDLRNTMRWDKVNVDNQASVLGAVDALTAEDGEKKVLVINDAYIDALKSNELIKGLLDGIVPVYTYNAETAYDYSLTDKPFQVMIYGSDDRDSAINDHSRYDTDIILTVNPLTKQVLMIGIPRDSYVYNTAHDGYDKLTHLGDDGPENSLAGINNKFESSINNYVLTNFTEFVNLVDFFGGLDIYNPYSFSNIWGDYVQKGDIHLDGDHALRYARERKNLPDGDMSRNGHQLILLKALMEKFISLETIAKFDETINQVQKCFQTNLTTKQLLGLAVMEYSEKPDWNMVSYHLYAEYELKDTATYKDQGQLRCGDLYQPDVDFAIAEMNKVMNGEIITQGTLPSD